MYEAQTWRVRPGEPFTFGRAPDCSAVLPAADRGVSRSAGSFRFHDRWWWLRNDSSSCVLCVIGDRGLGRKELLIRLAHADQAYVFRVDPDILVGAPGTPPSERLDAYLARQPVLGRARWQRGSEPALDCTVRAATATCGSPSSRTSSASGRPCAIFAAP